MAELILVEELQTYLVAQGVGVLPADADPARPSIWLSAAGRRAPRPRTGPWEAATVTLVDTQLGASTVTLRRGSRRAFVDVIVTAPNAGRRS
jgi:hypothetical protein